MDSSVKYGFGVTTPNEMARLFEILARGKAVSAKADSEMLYILERNSMDLMLQRFAGGARARAQGRRDRCRCVPSARFGICATRSSRAS